MFEVTFTEKDIHLLARTMGFSSAALTCSEDEWFLDLKAAITMQRNADVSKIMAVGWKKQLQSGEGRSQVWYQLKGRQLELFKEISGS